MQNTAQRILRFSQEIERLKDNREDLFHKAVDNREGISADQLNTLSENVHIFNEFLAMFQACFFQEIDAAKEANTISIQTNE